MSRVFFFLMIRRPPRSTLDRSSAASDVYKRQVTLTADSGFQYMWSTSETTQSIVVDTIGSYSVTVTDSISGLFAQSDMIDVSFYATTNPTISLLVSLLVSSPAVTYQWLLNGDTLVGETNSDLTPLVTGDYSVVVTDANGCILTSAAYTYLMPGIRELEKVTAFQLLRVGADVLEVSIHTPETGTIRLIDIRAVSYTHLRAHETVLDLVCRLLLEKTNKEKKKKKDIKQKTTKKNK